MYDNTINERSMWQRQQELLHEAEQARLAKLAQANHQPIRQGIITPVRRAAHLVAALIR